MILINSSVCVAVFSNVFAFYNNQVAFELKEREEEREERRKKRVGEREEERNLQKVLRPRRRLSHWINRQEYIYKQSQERKEMKDFSGSQADFKCAHAAHQGSPKGL